MKVFLDIQYHLDHVQYKRYQGVGKVIQQFSMLPTNYFSVGDLILPSCLRVYFSTKTVSTAVKISLVALKKYYVPKPSPGRRLSFLGKKSGFCSLVLIIGLLINYQYFLLFYRLLSLKNTLSYNCFLTNSSIPSGILSFFLQKVLMSFFWLSFSEILKKRLLFMVCVVLGQ